jgi:predicted metal-dependent hydrolase
MPESAERSQYKAEYWEDDEEMRWAIRHWAARIGVKEPHIHFQYMPEQWGHITTSGRLALDPTLLTMPKYLGEFVIVHELVHLLVPDHSKVFKLFMDAFLPDWREREQQIQQYTIKTD